MANERLTYARGALFGLLFLTLPMAIVAPLVALAIEDLAASGKLGAFALLGPSGLRLLLIAGAGLFLATSFGILRRMLGNGTAALIRPDGIELNGICVSSFVPWKPLDRVSICALRVSGTPTRLINAETNEFDESSGFRRIMLSQSKGISTRLLNENIEQAVAWAERANAARREAITNHHPSAASVGADEPIHGKRAQFGRRSVNLK